MSVAAKPRVRYKWGGKFRGAPAQAVGEELDRLREANKGRLEARDVLEAARDESSPLHTCFEWDDSTAAEVYRLDQARRICREIHVVIQRHNRQEKQYAFVHVTDAEGPRYASRDEVLSDKEVRQLALQEALDQLSALQRRYDFIAELKPVFAAFAKIQKKKQPGRRTA